MDAPKHRPNIPPSEAATRFGNINFFDTIHIT